jgi:hypothetical protein
LGTLCDPKWGKQSKITRETRFYGQLTRDTTGHKTPPLPSYVMRFPSLLTAFTASRGSIDMDFSFDGPTLGYPCVDLDLLRPGLRSLSERIGGEVPVEADRGQLSANGPEVPDED